MCIYSKLNNKQFDIHLLCLWSLFISYLIKVIYSGLHSVIFVSHDFNEYLKIVFYAVTGAILPFIVTYIYRCKIFRWFILKTNNQTINSDILDDVIDYDKKTMMYVYIKNTNLYYIGTFILKEENGVDSRIALIDYAVLNKETNDVIDKPNHKSAAIINLCDIERLELIYDDKSKTWERLTTKNLTRIKNKKRNRVNQEAE